MGDAADDYYDSLERRAAEAEAGEHDGEVACADCGDSGWCNCECPHCGDDHMYVCECPAGDAVRERTGEDAHPQAAKGSDHNG